MLVVAGLQHHFCCRCASTRAIFATGMVSRENGSCWYRSNYERQRGRDHVVTANKVTLVTKPVAFEDQVEGQAQYQAQAQPRALAAFDHGQRRLRLS